MAEAAFAAVRALCRELSAQLATLAPSLTAAARDLEQRGRPPDESLLRDLETLRGQCLDLRRQVMQLAAEKGLDGAEDDALDTPAGLVALLDRLEAIRAQEQGRRVGAVLERVLKLAYRDGSSSEPLEACQNQARALLAAVASGTDSPELEAMANRTHPFCDLLTLVEASPEDDADCVRPHARVAEMFGAALAVAVLRGRLIRRPSPPPADTPPVPEAPVVPAPREETPRPAPEQAAPPASAAPPIDAISPPAPVEVIPARPTPPPVELVSPPPAPSAKVEEPPPMRPELPPPPAAVAPVPAPPARIDEQEVKVPPIDIADVLERIWRLVRDDRLSLAMHLARCLNEVRPDLKAWAMLASVLRVVLLSRLVRYSSGEVVEELRQLLEEVVISVSRPPAGTPPLSTEVRLLLLGTSLRPALLAPRSQAPLLLEAVLGDKAPPALQTLGRAILEYTKLGLELTPTILKGVREHAAWQEELTHFRANCQVWLEHNRRSRIKYDPTTKAWWHWLENDQLLGQLLGCLINDHRKQAKWVRGTLGDLSSRKFVLGQLGRF